MVTGEALGLGGAIARRTPRIAEETCAFRGIPGKKKEVAQRLPIALCVWGRARIWVLVSGTGTPSWALVGEVGATRSTVR